jgi:hypothetical protein
MIVIILYSKCILVKIFIVLFTAHKSKHVRLPCSYTFVSEQVTPPDVKNVTRVSTTLRNLSHSYRQNLPRFEEILPDEK